MIEKELNRAINLRKNGNYDKSNSLLMKLVETNPDNASINYQYALNFDVLGEEQKAVIYYEKAIKLGLAPQDLEKAFLGLGSTYRTLGHYKQSKDTFLKGIELFPNNRAFLTFYSMTLYNLKEYSEAMELLLKCLIETTTDDNILDYKKAITFYSDKLDEIWS